MGVVGAGRGEGSERVSARRVPAVVAVGCGGEFAGLAKLRGRDVGFRFSGRYVAPGHVGGVGFSSQADGGEGERVRSVRGHHRGCELRLR